MERKWFAVLLVLGIFIIEGQSLKCFVCDTKSAESYAAANADCNQRGEVECPDQRATACMLEGYMQANNKVQVVKRCVPKCPVFINTTAEVVRCCPMDGCNKALDHRPPPPKDMRPPGRGGGPNDLFPPPPGFGGRGEEPGAERGEGPDMMEAGRGRRPDMPDQRQGMEGGEMPGMGAGGPMDPRMPPPGRDVPPQGRPEKKMPPPGKDAPPMRKDMRDPGREKGSSKRDMKAPNGQGGPGLKRRGGKAGKNEGLSGSGADSVNAVTLTSAILLVSGALIRDLL